jgi:hypothetical protein
MLRMNGTIPLLPLNALKAWKDTTSSPPSPHLLLLPYPLLPVLLLPVPSSSSLTPLLLFSIPLNTAEKRLKETLNFYCVVTPSVPVVQKTGTLYNFSSYRTENTVCIRSKN